MATVDLKNVICISLKSHNETQLDAIGATYNISHEFLVKLKIEGCKKIWIHIGGGFVIVPALKKISDLPMQSIVATSLGVIALISLGGVAGSSLSGNMNWSIAVPFACGAILGMLIGRIGASRISNQSIQLVFGIFLVLVGIALVIKSV